MQVNTQEQHEAEAAASRAMSDLIRGGHSPNRAPLAVALAELDEARASGDAERITAAGAAVDLLCDEARAAARPDFAGGAQPPPPTDPTTEWNDTLRRQASGLPQ